MSWSIFIALGALVVAIAIILWGAIYTSVSKYARRLDPAEHQHEEQLKHSRG